MQMEKTAQSQEARANGSLTPMSQEKTHMKSTNEEAWGGQGSRMLLVYQQFKAPMETQYKNFKGVKSYKYEQLDYVTCFLFSS